MWGEKPTVLRIWHERKNFSLPKTTKTPSLPLQVEWCFPMQYDLHRKATARYIWIKKQPFLDCSYRTSYLIKTSTVVRLYLVRFILDVSMLFSPAKDTAVWPPCRSRASVGIVRLKSPVNCTFRKLVAVKVTWTFRKFRLGKEEPCKHVSVNFSLIPCTIKSEEIGEMWLRIEWSRYSPAGVTGCESIIG